MFASTCSFTKNDPLCMGYHPYHFVGEVLLHPVYQMRPLPSIGGWIWFLISYSSPIDTRGRMWSKFSHMSSDHSPTFPSLHPRHSSFSNPSVTSPTSQLILQPFRRFTYVTAHSPTPPLLHLRHSSFFNPSFAFPTLQALHLRHLANRLWLPQFYDSNYYVF